MKIKPHLKPSLLKQIPKLSIRQEENNCFVISFKYLDKEQGQTFDEWQGQQILAKALHTLAHYCKDTLQNQYGDSFTIYGDFPPPDKTKFVFPAHVPEDANWARLHIDGKQIVVGHVHHNVFYVVFLDKDHHFWLSDKKGT